MNITNTPYHNEITQLRADALSINERILKLRKHGLRDSDIGFSLIQITLASDYEREMYRVYLALLTFIGYQRYTIQEVDGALIRSGIQIVQLDILRRQLAQKESGSELMRRFFNELTGIRLLEAS